MDVPVKRRATCPPPTGVEYRLDVSVQYK